MELIDRIVFFAIGGAVGFILGFVVAHLRLIEKKVDDVKNELHESDVKHKRPDERGAIRWQSIGLALALLLTLYGAFTTAKVNAALDDTVACLTEYNTNQGTALAARDQAIKDETQAEIDLWGLYNRLYRTAKSNPEKIPIIQDQLNKAIMDYREELLDTQEARDVYQYDDPDVLQDCEERKSE